MRSVALWVTVLLVYAFIGERFVWLTFVTTDPAVRLIAAFYAVSIFLLVALIAVWFKCGNAIGEIISLFREITSRSRRHLLLIIGIFLPCGVILGSRGVDVPWILQSMLGLCVISCSVVLGLAVALRLTRRFDKS
jgi:hypothetical protein